MDLRRATRRAPTCRRGAARSDRRRARPGTSRASRSPCRDGSVHEDALPVHADGGVDAALGVPDPPVVVVEGLLRRAAELVAPRRRRRSAPGRARAAARPTRRDTTWRPPSEPSWSHMRPKRARSRSVAQMPPSTIANPLWSSMISASCSAPISDQRLAENSSGNGAPPARSSTQPRTSLASEL